MKRNIILFSVLAAVIVLFAACKKDEIIYFDLENDSAVCFPGAYRDLATYPGYNIFTQIYSLDFSFQTLPLGTEYAIVDFPIKIVGNTADHDRYAAVNYVSTAEASDYEFLELVIPANEMYGHIRIKVNYKESLNDVRDTLWMEIIDHPSSLKKGTNEYTQGIFSWSNIIPAIPTANFNRQSYNLIILSEQGRTANNLTAYSPNAHKAILEAMGWPTGFWVRYNQGFDPYNMVNVLDAIYYTDFYAQKLHQYLNDYEAKNGERLKHNAGSQQGKDVVARISGAVYVP